MAGDKSIDVSILMVSYNTRDLTAAALQSIVSQTSGLKYEIIVVDNASSDGSAEMLQRHSAVSRLIALNVNIGFARANNLAAEYAQGRYILLLNTDTVILNRAIERLVEFAEAHKQYLVWGGRTLFADGSLNPSSVWRHITVWSLICRISGLSGFFSKSDLFNREAFGDWKRDRVREVGIVAGCFFLMPATVWNALGGFDPLFFMYGEDADLCKRAQRIGARPHMTPEAEIIHYGAASAPNSAEKHIQLLSGLATLFERHWFYPTHFIGQQMLVGWALSRWVAFTAASYLSRRADYKNSATLWKTIWNRRSEWQFGYSTATETEAERQARSADLAFAQGRS